ncbi:hypothetical protein LTR08_006838 [Meristemomyces frigidus]|nr:hypothetical protein LTR08_006838 [Meristemomyces frigidus]
MSKVTPAALPLAQGLKNIFMDEKYSDLSISCGERAWKVHKLVLCTQSSFFSTACEGEFKEAKEHKIDLSDDGVHFVSTMLHSLYHFDYDDAHHVKHGVDPVVLNVRMVMAGDKYFSTTLRDLAMQKLKMRITADWDKASFGAAITMAYSNTTASAGKLRALLVEVAQNNADVLFGDGVHLDFQKAPREQPDFMFDYSKKTAVIIASRKFAIKNMAGQWYQCPGRSCTQFDVTFKIGQTPPKNFHLNCPMRCSMNKDQVFWKAHVVKDPEAPASQHIKVG